MGLFSLFASRNIPRPFSPPPAIESRNFTPAEDMRIEPSSGGFPTGTPRFAPPEPATAPTPVNMYGVPVALSGPSDQPQTVNPASTTARGVVRYHQERR
jgi:hypothetical protein